MEDQIGGDLSADIEELVEEWLARLPPRKVGEARSAALLDSYRVLGRSVLRSGLRENAPTPDESRELKRTLDRLTAESRRSGHSISHMLDDIGGLPTVLFRWLYACYTDMNGGNSPVPVLEIAESSMRALGAVTSRLVHLLEATAARAARESSQTLNATTEMLSHELKNRLGAAKTASEMLLNSDVSDRGLLEKVAQLVRSSVEDGLQTVGDVQTLIETSADHAKGSPRTMKLDDLVRRVVDELEPTARQAGVAIKIVGDVVPCQVDASRLRLILFNLVGNGIKYRDEGKEHSYVQVQSRSLDQERVEVRVSDNGVGIPRNELEDIFAYQVRGDGSQCVPGSGLGLAIAREAVEQVRGEIRVESEVDVGTTFRLILPRLGPTKEPP